MLYLDRLDSAGVLGKFIERGYMAVFDVSGGRSGFTLMMRP
jgi:hypothetical protein